MVKELHWTEPSSFKKTCLHCIYFSGNDCNWIWDVAKSNMALRFRFGSSYFFRYSCELLVGKTDFILAKTACSGKFWFLQYLGKWSQNIIFVVFLDFLWIFLVFFELLLASFFQNTHLGKI